ncbi:MAG: hypothetical protein V4675_24690 [Verrucomicrobiota bacterium]
MKTASAHVIVQNKSYRLWQRSADANSPWWVRLQIHGVRTAVSTKTGDLPTAKLRAAAFIAAALDGDLSAISAQTTPRAGKPAPIGEIIASLNASPLPSAPRYTRALTDLITKAKDLPPSKITAQPSSILTAQLVNAFQSGATPEQHGPLNAILRNAKAAFSKNSLTFLEKQSIPLPDLTAFLAAPELPEDPFCYSDSPISAKQLKDLAKLEVPPPLRTLHSLVCLCGLTTHEATHATAKDFAPGGIFFPRFPCPPDFPLPKKGPALPLKSEADRTALVHSYKALLAPLKLTPHHLRFHAAHRWLNRSNSLDAAATFLGVSLQWAKYHLSELPRDTRPLSWPELLGEKI